MINTYANTLLNYSVSGISLRRALPAAMLLAALLPALLVNLTLYPDVWLDEGFSLNAAQTLAATGQYGTTSAAGVRPFDPAISTGAPVIAPLALAVRLAGPGLGAARLVIVLFTLAAAFALYAAARFIYGSRAALLLTLALVALPTLATRVSFVALGRQVMGENPALLLGTLALLVWWHSWARADRGLALLAGGLLGLALLTKLQIVLMLLPTMLIIGGLRARQTRTGLLRAWLPVGAALAVYVGWLLLAQAGTPPALRADHRAVMLDGLRTNFLLLPGSRPLSTTAYAMLLLSLAGAGGTLARLLRRPRGQRLVTERQWAEASLVTLVLLGSVGAGLFSIGWERYLYGVFVPGLLLLGSLAWDVLRRAARRAGIHETAAFTLAAAALLALALAVHVIPALRADPAAYTSVRRMADQIALIVPPDAVIETWEWELAALTVHRAFHYPHQLVLQQTLRDYAREGTFNLRYDALQADPDFLLQGPFSAWTGIYTPAVLAAHFRVACAYGPFTLYARVRPPQTANVR